MNNTKQIITISVFYRLLLVLIPAMLMCPGAGIAQDREYYIELLVFEHLADSGIDEQWLQELADIPDKSGNLMQVNWLSPSKYQLSGTRKSLQNSKNHLPLLHTAWRQVVRSKKASAWIDMPVPDTQSASDSYVDGSARVSLGRYLHLDLDLILHHGLMQPENNYLSQNNSYGLRLKESRRMRSKKIHYFDHPHFGVLALITPVK